MAAAIPCAIPPTIRDRRMHLRCNPIRCGDNFARCVRERTQRVFEGLKSLRDDYREREMFCDSAIRRDLRRALVSVSGFVVLSDGSRSNVSLSCSNRSACRESCACKTSQRSARDGTSTSIDLVSAERVRVVCASAHMLRFKLTTIHSGSAREHTRALWTTHLPYFRFVILTIYEKIGARRRRRAYTRMRNEVRDVFAPCCRRSPSRVLGLPLAIQDNASLTEWIRSDCPTWTAFTGRKNIGAALRAVLISRRVVSTMARCEGRRRGCAALTRTGG